MKELFRIQASASPQIRSVIHEGRPHLAVPIIALKEGVVWPGNSDVPEFVPASVLAENPSRWDGRPVVMNHPSRNGQMLSASSPEVQRSYKIGTIFNTKSDDDMLRMEAWIDPVRMRKLSPEAARALDRILAQEIVDVSIGAYTRQKSEEGEWKSRKYKVMWTGLTPDHLAILPEGTPGACSVVAGCGTRMLSAWQYDEDEDLVVEALAVLGGKGSGHFGHDGRPGMRGGSEPGDGDRGPRSQTPEERRRADRYYEDEDDGFDPDTGDLEYRHDKFRHVQGDFVRYDKGVWKVKGILPGGKGIVLELQDPDYPFTREKVLRDDVGVNLMHPSEVKQFVKRSRLAALGGPGSGHHGHDGRPGEVGGSQPGDGDGNNNDTKNDKASKPKEKKKSAPKDSKDKPKMPRAGSSLVPTKKQERDFDNRASELHNTMEDLLKSDVGDDVIDDIKAAYDDITRLSGDLRLARIEGKNVNINSMKSKANKILERIRSKVPSRHHKYLKNLSEGEDPGLLVNAITALTGLDSEKVQATLLKMFGKHSEADEDPDEEDNDDDEDDKEDPDVDTTEDADKKLKVHSACACGGHRQENPDMKTMDERISALIASKKNGFTPAHTEFLKTCSEDQLKALEAADAAAEEPKTDPTPAPAKPITIDDLPKELKDLVASAQSQDGEVREAAMKVLKESKQTVYTEDELKALSTKDLVKVAQIVEPKIKSPKALVDFSARNLGGSIPEPAVAETSAPVPKSLSARLAERAAAEKK